MTTALKPVEEIKRYYHTDPRIYKNKSEDWLIEYICHMAASLNILDRMGNLWKEDIYYLRCLYHKLVTCTHPATGRDFVSRWMLLFDDHGHELIVKFLNREYQDGFTPSGYPITGVNELGQVAIHVIPNSVLWTAEKWAISVIVGEKWKENETPEDLERQIIEAWRALP